MTGINKLQPEYIPCPLCETPVETEQLAILGIPHATMMTLRNWRVDGTMTEGVQAGTMMLRRTEEGARDLAINATLREEINPVYEILKKLGKGQDELSQAFIPRKGDYAEEINIRLFEACCPKYKFEQRQAAQGTSDSICTAIESEKQVGTITISIKNTAKWSNEYLTQAEKDMEVDGTDAAIIVVKRMPSKPKTNVTTGIAHYTRGTKIVIVAQLGPATAALGMLGRYLAQVDKNNEDYARKIEMLDGHGKAIEQWLSSDAGKKAIQGSAVITELAEGVRKTAALLKNSVAKKLDEIISSLVKIVAETQTSDKAFDDLHRTLISNRSKKE